jgi:hypothetical protein
VKTSALLIIITSLSALAKDDFVGNASMDISSYLEAAYDVKSDISKDSSPGVSEGVRAIAEAQNLAKQGTPLGVKSSIQILENHIKLGKSDWESDFVRCCLAIHLAADGDFDLAARTAEEALLSVDFGRLQTARDPALDWIRLKFGGEKFSVSIRDYLNRIVGNKYLYHSSPPDLDKAQKYFSSISDEKLRLHFLNQIKLQENDKHEVEVRSSNLVPRESGLDWWENGGRTCAIVAILAVLTGLLVKFFYKRSSC